METQAIWEVCMPGAQAHGLELTNDGLVTFAGGIPLKTADGRVIGAVGVSGGQVAQDFEIAGPARGAQELIETVHTRFAGVEYEQEDFDHGRRLGSRRGCVDGLAREGHHVIAAAQTWPQVTALRGQGAGAQSSAPGRKARPA